MVCECACDSNLTFNDEESTADADSICAASFTRSLGTHEWLAGCGGAVARFAQPTSIMKTPKRIQNAVSDTPRRAVCLCEDKVVLACSDANEVIKVLRIKTFRATTDVMK